MPGIRIEIKGNAVDRPYFVLKDSEGKALAISESFMTRAECEQSIVRMRENVSIAQIVENDQGPQNPKFNIQMDVQGKYRFTLFSVQGDKILTSEAYDQKTQCRMAAEGLKKYGSEAKILDFL